MPFPEDVDAEMILLKLVQGKEGAIWSSQRTGWKTNDAKDVCDWDGIYCDPNDNHSLAKILLSSSGLTATLPTELGLLTSLTDISIAQNSIHGSIPSDIAGLSNLVSINLSSNQITGSIPLFSSTALKHISLNDNQLFGSIPNEIGVRHEKMILFDVSNNKLSGTIPDTFSNMYDLEKLSLSSNKFTGSIPASVGATRVLHSLYLDHNYIMGTVPPSIARFSSAIGQLWLQNNLLSGTIPAEVADMPQLYEFFVDGNKITGTVPKALCRKNLNKGFFEGVEDHVKRNYCDAVGCSVGYVSKNGSFPCIKCQGNFSNPYIGMVGECLEYTEPKILQSIYNSTGGINWNIQWNFEYDQCTFAGISCDASHKVIGINLKDVGLI